MTRQERFDGVINYFRTHMPVAETELHYKNPFQLLVAVILSAQCTDKRVNMVTPKLFKDYPNAEALAAATPEVIFDYIRSISYPNNKAKHLVGMARMLLHDFGNRVPSEVEELVKLRDSKKEQVERERKSVREANEKVEASARKKAGGNDPVGQTAPA